MSQDEQLDIFGEFTAPAPDEQPEHSRKGEVGERKEHSAILPSVALGEPPRSCTSDRQSVAQSRPIWYSRARVKQK